MYVTFNYGGARNLITLNRNRFVKRGAFLGESSEIGQI